MSYTYEILLISNRFDHRLPVTYFSTLIRIGTCSQYNHAAILQLRDGVPRRVIEAVGEGVISTPYAEWHAKTARKVLRKPVLQALDQKNIDLVLALIGEVAYGAGDIAQLAKYIVLNRWLALEYEWDGVRGTGFLKGVFCSELVGLLLGDPKAHLRFPGDFEHDRTLGEGEIFYTQKGVAPVLAFS